jgi:hypothetical protein
MTPTRLRPKPKCLHSFGKCIALPFFKRDFSSWPIQIASSTPSIMESLFRLQGPTRARKHCSGVLNDFRKALDRGFQRARLVIIIVPRLAA